MQVDSGVYDWLKELKLVYGRVKQLQNQNIMISDEQAKLFQNGIQLGKLLTQITDNYNVINDVARLKNLQNPSTRVYNWNIIQNCLKCIDYKLEGEIKSLIVSGDNEMLSDLLKELYKTFKLKPQLQLPNINQINQSFSHNNSSIRSITNENNMSYPIDYFENQLINNEELNDPNRVDISQIDINKRLSDCTSLLEFILVGLCKELNLKPKQAVGLLANNNKYLAVGLIKGMKTSFQPLCNWLQNVYVNIKTVLGFIEKEESDLFRFLDMIKPGLQSSSEQVALWSTRIISKVAFEVSNTDILPQTYQWFIRENGGLQSCVLCLKRHKVIKMNVVQIITQIAKYNLSDLFIVQLRKLFDDIKEYIRYISLIFPNLMEMQNYKEELLANRILDFWIEQSQKIADYDPIKNSVSDRQAALQLLCDCWITYPRHITDNLQISIQILDLLKKGSRDFSQVLKFHSLQLLFVLLENFANQKNPATALIYKKLTFSLIENSSDTNLREFILRNFAHTFKKYAQMPPDVLLDPFIKQIQLRSTNNIFTMNTCEVEFFTTISSHPGLNLKTAIQMTDMLSKMYLQDIIWSQSLFQSIKNLIDRFIENETFQEYAIKLSQASLNMIQNSYNQLLQQPGRFQQDYTTEQEQVIIEAQRRALIIELNKFILEREVPSLNKEIRDFVVQVQQDLLASGIQYKGIYQLLLFFGDPDQVIQKFKDEQLAKQKDFEYNLFQMQQNQKSSTAHSDSNQKPQQYLRKNSNEIDWGDAFESSPRPPKINNYGFNNNSQPVVDGSPSMRQYNTNTYGANRMDFQQFEQTNLQHMNQLQKTRDHNMPLFDSIYEKDNKYSSMLNKTRAHVSLERRKDEIDQIREKRENKSLLNDLDKFWKYQKEQQLKKETEQEVNKIHTKLNVGKQKQTDQYAQLIYEEKELDTIKSLNKHKIVKIEDLEQRDIDSLDIVMKQYANTFKFVFSRYSNIHKMFNKKNDLFQEQKNTSELISFGDVWNCCKDFDLQKFVSRDDVLNIMKQVNSNPQYTFLKYSDFVQFIVQLSIFMFSQPPKDLRGQPLGNQLRELFQTMALYKKNKSVNPAIFENPECFAPNLDVMTIKSWNNRLLKDPNIPLPDNLKKVQEKQYYLNNNFDGNKIIGLSEGYTLAYSVLQDILKEKFNISIGESKMQIVNIVQARPKPIPSIATLQKIIPNKPDPLTPQHTKKTNSMSVKDLRNLKQQNIYQSLWVEKYSQYGLPGLPKSRKVILNQAEKNRLEKEEEEIKKQQSLDRKMKQRIKEVELQKDVIEAFKAKKRQEELEKEQKKIQEMEKEKEKYQRQRLQQLAMKNELNKKLEEKKIIKMKQIQEQLEKQQEMEQRRREQIEANKQRVEYREGQVELRNMRKKIQETEKQHKEQERQSSLQNKHKNLNEVALQKEQERKERQNEFKYLFDDLQVNPEVRKIFQDNSRTLSTLFSLYKHYQDIKIQNQKDTEQVDQLSYRGFYLICSHFKILPQILNSDEVTKMYNNCARNNYEGQYGIVYEQFEELLLRIAVKGRPVFDEISKYDQEDPENIGINYQEVAKDQIRKLQQEKLERLKLKSKNQDQDKKKIQLDFVKDNVEQVSIHDIQNLKLTTPGSLKGLITYLELPQDKHYLFQYVKSLQGENQDNKNQFNGNSSIYSKDPYQGTRGRNGSTSSSPIRDRTSSLQLQKKYPKSKKYSNIQSKYKSSVQGDPFSNKQRSNTQIPK
ncbi:hypothetical protein ABPG74_006381 [Tetrahymena malaccensis]